MSTGSRPWGVPKTKPVCKNCGKVLIGDTQGSLNISATTSNINDGKTGIPLVGDLFCNHCGEMLDFTMIERVLTYWRNGGIRQKPGRKPKVSDNPAA